MTYRTRTRGVLSDPVQYKYRTKYCNGNWAPDVLQDGGGYTKVGETQTTIDVVTPGYQRRVERGEIINNPFQTWIETRSHSVGGASAKKISTCSGTTIKEWYWDGSYGWPSRTYPGIPTHNDINAECDLVSTEARARVAATQIDGTTEVGEARETMELFHHHNMRLQGRLNGWLKEARRRPSRYLTGPLGFFGNNWLRYRYGIMPLVNLMTNALVGPKIQSVRETARAGTLASGNEEYSDTIQGGFWRFDWVYRKSFTASVRAGILYERSGWYNPYGFDLHNIPATLWELTPYSFVVDWFANTGSFIRAITPKSKTRSLATWLGYEQSTTITVTQENVTWVGDSYHTPIKAPSAEFIYTLVQRRRLPGIRGPSLTLLPNSLGKVATSKRIIDAFFLTYQILTRSKL